MNISQDILLKLLRCALFGKEEPIDNPQIQWCDVFAEAKAQAVTALALEGAVLLHAPISEQVMESWRCAALQSIIAYEHLAASQDHLVRSLNDAAVSILKGMSVARYYPRPELRTMGDIDFLVSKGQYEVVVDRMFAAGYKEDSCSRGKNPHVFYHNGVRFEKHEYMNGLPANLIGEELTSFIQAGLEHVHVCEADGHQFPVLPAAQQGLTLLLHMTQHIQCSGMGLRQFCDWALYIVEETPIRLQDDLECILKKSGLYHFAQIVTQLAMVYLGLPETTAPWAVDADKETCKMLMEDLLCAGNMGIKNREFYRGRQLIAERYDGKKMPGLIRIFKNLEWIGIREWKAVQKHPYLKMVAWGYWPIQYLRKVHHGERSLFALPSMLRGMHKSRRLIDTLQLYR